MEKGKLIHAAIMGTKRPKIETLLFVQWNTLGCNLAPYGLKDLKVSLEIGTLKFFFSKNKIKNKKKFILVVPYGSLCGFIVALRQWRHHKAPYNMIY
jgi:hypothetical protein